MCTSYHVFPEENIEMRGIISQLMENFPGLPIKQGRVYPSEQAAVLTTQGPRPMRFGIHLPYRKQLLLNARSETAAQSPLFSPLLKGSRCLVPANEFYEWTAQKQARLFSSLANDLLYMAALYTQQQEHAQFVILTRAADAQVAPVHDRMPVLLQSVELRDVWLHNPPLAEQLLQLDLHVPLGQRAA